MAINRETYPTLSVRRVNRWSKIHSCAPDVLAVKKCAVPGSCLQKGPLPGQMHRVNTRYG